MSAHLEVVEYEHLGDTPTTGGPIVFLWCLAQEVDYLAAGDGVIPPTFRVAVDVLPTGTYRYLVAEDGDAD